jgi:hypothetical protein
VTTWFAELDQKDYKALAAELPQFCIKLIEEVERAYKPGEWNRLYLEYWFDSGRVIAYPHKRGTMRSKWRVGLQLYIPLVEEEFEALPDPEEDPDAFESGSVAIDGRLGYALTRAASKPEVRKALRRLKESNDFTIFLQDADDEESAYQFFLAF